MSQLTGPSAKAKFKVTSNLCGCPSEKKFVRAPFSGKPPQTIYQKKSYKNVEFDKIMFCFGFYFPKAAEAINPKMTD